MNFKESKWSEKVQSSWRRDLLMTPWRVLKSLETRLLNKNSGFPSFSVTLARLILKSYKRLQTETSHSWDSQCSQMWKVNYRLWRTRWPGEWQTRWIHSEVLLRSMRSNMRKCRKLLRGEWQRNHLRLENQRHKEKKLTAQWWKSLVSQHKTAQNWRWSNLQNSKNLQFTNIQKLNHQFETIWNNVQKRFHCMLYWDTNAVRNIIERSSWNSVFFFLI